MVVAVVFADDALGTVLFEGFLDGSYDCVDRVLLRAYFQLGQRAPGVVVAVAVGRSARRVFRGSTRRRWWIWRGPSPRGKRTDTAGLE